VPHEEHPMMSRLTTAAMVFAVLATTVIVFAAQRS
jgi:hypothetical protein